MNEEVIRTANLIWVIQHYLLTDEPLENWLDTENNPELGGLFSPAIFQDAQIYQRHLAGKLRDVSFDTINAGERAIGIYTARYIIEKLPKETIEAIANSLKIPVEDETKKKPFCEDTEKVSKLSNKLYEAFEKALGETKLKYKFQSFEPIYVTKEMLESPEKLFRYPHHLIFTENAIETMVKKIRERKVSPRIADYFLGSLDTYEDSVPALPAVEVIIEHAENTHAVWTAGDTLNLIWKLLPGDDDFLSERFERLVYQLYWPKIGSTWPIIHYSRFEFKEEQDDNLFRDSLGWLMSLKTIEKLNPELAHYLHFLGGYDMVDQIQSGIPEPVRFRAFAINNEGKTSKAVFNRVIKEFAEQEALSYLAHPEGTEEAKLVIDYALSGKLDPENVPFIIEKLVINGNYSGVGPYIINRYAKDAETLEKLFKKLDKEESKNHNIIISIFDAAVDGASEKAELPALKKFADSIKALPTKKDLKEGIAHHLDRGLLLAEDTVKDFERARKKLIEQLAY